MGPREAALALDLLGQPRCVPCHWGTFPLLTGTPDALAALADRARRSSSSSRATRSRSRPRDVLDRRLRPRRGPVGRRDAVEVPRGRLGRAVGRAAASARSRRRPTRTRATAPTGCALLRGGLGAQEVVEHLVRADDGREHRQLGVVDGARRQRDATPARSAWTGPAALTGPGFAAQGNILVSGETVDALARHVRRVGGAAARRAAARRARRRAGRRRRPPRPAVGGAARRRARRRLRGPLRRRWSTCASTTTPRRSTSCAGSTTCTSCCSARRRAEEWLDVDDEPRARARASASRASATTARSRGVRRPGPAPRTSRSASTASSASTRSCSRSCGADERPAGKPSTSTTSTRSRSPRASSGARCGAGSGSARSATTSTRARASASTSSRTTTSTGSGAGGHEEMYVVIRGRATFTLDGEDARRAGRHDRLHPRPGAEARRDRRGGGHRRPGGRGRAGQRLRGLAVGVQLRRDPASARGGAGTRRSRCSRRACASIPATRRSSTTSPAPSRRRAGRSTRSRTSRRRSAATRRTSKTRAPTRTSTRSAASPAFRREHTRTAPRACAGWSIGHRDEPNAPCSLARSVRRTSQSAAPGSAVVRYRRRPIRVRRSRPPANPPRLRGGRSSSCADRSSARPSATARSHRSRGTPRRFGKPARSRIRTGHLLEHAPLERLLQCGVPVEREAV